MWGALVFLFTAFVAFDGRDFGSGDQITRMAWHSLRGGTFLTEQLIFRFVLGGG